LVVGVPVPGCDEVHVSSRAHHCLDFVTFDVRTGRRVRTIRQEMDRSLVVASINATRRIAAMSAPEGARAWSLLDGRSIPLPAGMHFLREASVFAPPSPSYTGGCWTWHREGDNPIPRCFVKAWFP
jgi:hypothetical protein